MAPPSQSGKKAVELVLSQGRGKIKGRGSAVWAVQVAVEPHIPHGSTKKNAVVFRGFVYTQEGFWVTFALAAGKRGGERFYANLLMFYGRREPLHRRRPQEAAMAVCRMCAAMRPPRKHAAHERLRNQKLWVDRRAKSCYSTPIIG